MGRNHTRTVLALHAGSIPKEHEWSHFDLRCCSGHIFQTQVLMQRMVHDTCPGGHLSVNNKVRNRGDLPS